MCSSKEFRLVTVHCTCRINVLVLEMQRKNEFETKKKIQKTTCNCSFYLIYLQ